MITTTEIDVLKENIYEIVADIKDEKVLIAIKTIIDNLETNTLYKDTIKRDLGGYIKEWAKSI